MATIALLGTMDTKGTEYAFLSEQIQKRGHHTLVIDTGTVTVACGKTVAWTAAWLKPLRGVSAKLKVLAGHAVVSLFVTVTL